MTNNNHIDSWEWFERLTHFLPYGRKTEIGTMGFHRLLEELKDTRVNIKTLDDAITDTLVYVSGLAESAVKK